jgi:protein-tyrosine phosphatase
MRITTKKRFAYGVLATALTFGTAATVLAPAAQATAVQSAKAGNTSVTPHISDASAVRNADGSYGLSWTKSAATKLVVIYATTDADADGSDAGIVGEITLGSSTTVTGLDPAKRWYFELVPANDYRRGMPVAVRGLGLATAPNARDLGGYETTDGRFVRWGQVYRTDALGKTTPADVAKLGNLKLKQSIDFRTPTEVASDHADVLPAGVNAVAKPIDDHGLFNTMMGAIGSKDPVKQQEMLGNGNAENLLKEIYASFVTDPASRAQFGDTLRSIATGDTTLFHCTSGKDRTGWMAYILLTALGVSDADAKADYMLTNDYRAAADKAQREGLKQAGIMENPDLLIPLQGVSLDYLQSALDAVKAEYGTVDAYITQGLGIDAATVAKLKKNLLIK